MENNKHKEEWINKVINSTHGMPRANPPTGVYEKMMAGLNKPETTRIVLLPVRQWAAAAIILLALNVGSVVYYTSKEKATPTNNNNPMTIAIQMGSTYNY